MFDLHPRFLSALEPDFRPASLWNRAYQSLVARDPGARPCAITLGRPDGTVSRHDTRLLGPAHPAAALTLEYVERLLKFLLWQKGGSEVLVAGADEVTARLARIYHPAGERTFDHAFMGETVYGRPFRIAAAGFAALPEERSPGLPLGRNLQGCRIGFDIGGSDRKVAAVVDGRVVFSEEVAWDPYFQQDPAYHIEGVHASLQRAAAHLPRVDAIGGSAAGVYVNNEVRVASLFRGVPPELFERHIRRMFFTLRERWGGVPFEVANDGEVTALAGSMSLSDNAVLGVSMGTSMAGGYVRASGEITAWLNELAFAPIDHNPGAPGDEWSGDIGCGVQYFSQQGVARFAQRAGFAFAAGMPVPEQLVMVQQALAAGDPRARAVYEAVGICFGYALAHYADFYEFRHLLLLGRVTSGEGGAVILNRAAAVLRDEFPDLAARLQLHMPDEKSKRHGQAIAAASLPALGQPAPAIHSLP
ncbi:ROK family protein [Opitutus sp. GAS368]|uniref:ROK family protein n=1 Tax=Opitutus sp. GAS368 TaxID=1882749 RepID=UPI00087D287E|nr:ROK family protein [Opitutus sp. GAS368]SDR81155.1 Sugar kinase of the NBD/HSP70 family, may contain an N-terminal HTH domain [Opitutus sp. GAS368]